MHAIAGCRTVGAGSAVGASRPAFHKQNNRRETFKKFPLEIGYDSGPFAISGSSIAVARGTNGDETCDNNDARGRSQ